MRKLINDHAALVLVTVGLAVAAVAAPTLAGTVYSWTTEDGTSAYTDDPKRIPAKYKKQVDKRQLGKLKNYPRFTESQVKHEKEYEDRVDERLGALREGPPSVSAGPPSAEGVRYGVGISQSDNDQLSFPVGGGSDEPIVTSEHRIRRRNSIATQDVYVTKQGDKVLSVRLGAANQRKINERLDDETMSAIGDVQPSIGP